MSERLHDRLHACKLFLDEATLHCAPCCQFKGMFMRSVPLEMFIELENDLEF